MSTAADSATVPAPPAALSNGVPPRPDYSPRYIDIGINLADPIFRGRYRGKQQHPDDLAGIVQRARDVGCSRLIVTGSSFKSSRDALKLAGGFPNTVFTTAGIHPCSSAIFERRHTRHHEVDDDDDTEEHTPVCGPDPTKPHAEDSDIDLAKSAQLIEELRKLVLTAEPTNALVALGEMGLDYDRLHFCSASTQRHAFAAQLALVADLAAAGHPLPLFLHSRAAHADFLRLLKDQFGPTLEKLPRGGVVHSFTGTMAEAQEMMDLGLYLGVNGCSLKTVENCDVVRAIRLDRLMLETDGPWCEVRPTHEGWKYLVKVAEAARAKAEEAEEARKAAEKAAEDAARQAAEQAAQEAAATATADGNATPDGAAAGNGRPPRPPRQKKQNNNAANNNSKKKEPVVPERFKVVKKEKWVEGAMVKGRNEPCTIERIATIVAAIKGVPVEEVCEAAWANTVKVFGTA
ncbi:TatD DNase family protein [Sporothrix brasiliensis 5110]|uniref:TatD DNase family protein n=1 Tax=Sporothrix brasiliensis 5110 TaxID=1398154 RepID=A0A0C2IZ02_9PEZI|nr:TatD DNase family protein [Sporothrix brasiliensis 5110]KIH94346.1 TatD DNase family protein [Sporothrix brasiliensis 5110]